MSDPYLDAILTMGGGKRWQMFERFITILAQNESKWRDKHIRRTHDHEGAFDVFIEKSPGGELVAQIECKAYSQRSTASVNGLKSLLKTLNPNKLQERVEKVNPCETIIALPVEVDEAHWNELRESAENPFPQGWQLWHAGILADKLRLSPAAAAQLPYELPNKHPIFDECLIAIIRERPEYYGVPVSQLLTEQEHEVLSEWKSSQHVIVTGPPHIGKTCWALRQAMKWERGMANKVGTTSVSDNSILPTAFLINLTRTAASDVGKLLQVSGEDDPLLLVFDDVHFNKADLQAWIETALSDVKQQPKNVRTIWVSRDPSVQGEIEQGLKNSGFVPERDTLSTVLPFPVESVVDLYLKGITGADEEDRSIPYWQRHLVALEAGLDPRIALHLEQIVGNLRGDAVDDNFKLLCGIIERYLRDRIRRGLAETETSVASREAYQAYLRILPFGTLNFPLPIQELAAIGVQSVVDIEKLVRSGWAVYLSDDKVLLTGHPIHTQKILKQLAHFPDRYWLCDRHAGSNGNDHLMPNVQQRIFSQYFEAIGSKGDLLESLNELALYGDWAGVRAPLAEGLAYFLDNHPAGRGICEEQVWPLREKLDKLQRTSFPYNEKAFVKGLKQSREAWSAQLEKARRTEGNIRVDHAHYEIAYTHKLVGEFEDAAREASNSVTEAFKLIDKGIVNGEDDKSRIQGIRALAHIWVSHMVARQALMLEGIYQALNADKPFNNTAWVRDAAVLHKRLRALNEAIWSDSNATVDDLPGFWEDYVVPLLQTLRPEWTPPSVGYKAYTYRELKETHLLNVLRRHQSNAWGHVHYQACSPMLYGLTDQMTESVDFSIPSHNYLWPNWNAEGVEATLNFGARYSHTLRNWCYESKDKAAADKLGRQAFEILVLTRSGEYFENIAEKVLLAWRTATDPNVKAFLRWYAKERVPDAGYNKVAKLALEIAAKKAS